jgi:hypothetical protein
MGMDCYMPTPWSVPQGAVADFEIPPPGSRGLLSEPPGDMLMPALIGRDVDGQAHSEAWGFIAAVQLRPCLGRELFS